MDFEELLKDLEILQAMQSDLRRKALHDVFLEKKINLPYEEIKADKLTSRPHVLVYSTTTKKWQLMSPIKTSGQINLREI